MSTKGKSCQPKVVNRKHIEHDYRLSGVTLRNLGDGVPAYRSLFFFLRSKNRVPLYVFLLYLLVMVL